jgi:molecular chaperone DnaK
MSDTIDFGIDLGTTNSEIAVCRGGLVQVLRNNANSEITPSVVRLNGSGAVTVGKAAYDHRVDDDKNTHEKFKRLMGGAEHLHFARSGKSFSPEELSAEILKSLRQDARRTLGEEIRAAVITVPAMFEIPQCEATRRAAVLAGIEHSPLLQEPIAAALAYEYGPDAGEGYLLVYDLGGGTFDCSLLRSRDGRLTVVSHAGDNRLGGKDFDDLLALHFVRLLVREFGLTQAQYDANKVALAKLLAKAEEAKIQLSAVEGWEVDIEGLGRGLENFEASFTLTRRDYEEMIRPTVARTISITETLLKEARLDRDAISDVILVGGPTMTPMIRAAVAEATGRRPKANVDPMTVVAQGAARFAAGQRLPTASVAVPAGAISVRLVFDPVSQDLEPTVGGKLAGGDVARIEITRADGGWRSGLVPVQGNLFQAPVVLNPRQGNGFQLRAFDAAGRQLSIAPDQFSIHHGPMVESAPLSRSIRVGLADNTSIVLAEKGVSVPFAGRSPRGTILTAIGVAPGQAAEVLRIPLLQGEYERSDRNTRIGELRIGAGEVARALRSGSEVEIRLAIDPDFQVTVTAYIPELDQTFEKICEQRVSPVPVLNELADGLEAERRRLASLAAGGGERRGAEQALAAAQAGLGQARRGDADAARKAEQDLRDLRSRIDAIEDAGRWPALESRWREAQAFAEESLAAGTAEDSRRLDEIQRGATDAISGKRFAGLERQIERAISLAWEVLSRADAFWVEALREMSTRAATTTQPKRAGNLLEEGRLAIGRNDFDSLRTIVRELWSLLPPEAQEVQAIRYASGLRRAAGA